MQRVLPLLALSMLALLGGSECSRAELTYPWCAQYAGGGDGGGGARNCGFWTYEQCMATVSGIGGYREVNADHVSWRVVAKCSNQREQWTSNVRLTVNHNRLTWTSKRGTQIYTRCAPDVLMAAR